ncbi:uncharacterized protein isoform X2 [Rhodnius prolixus]|uniref:uncharacterized protein isoform X2 n=1 Tax=Rhodnius prolixus TaxID=13249 RepID=UPI003D18DC71
MGIQHFDNEGEENEHHGRAAEPQHEQNIEVEEEPETEVSSNGSVLMPSDSPYDKFEKIKEANSELFAAIISKPKSQCKVHFDQNIVTHSVEYDDALEESVLTEVEEEEPCPVDEVELNSSTESSDSNCTVICRPSKVLLVTVPTAFTEQVEDEYEDDIDVVDEEEEDEETYEINNVPIPKNELQMDNINENRHSEEEVIIEDLTDVGGSSVHPDPTLVIHHHKPVLTKDARVEEDSDSDIDLPRLNSSTDNFEFLNESVENLIENLQECSISSQIEVENIETKDTEKYRIEEDENNTIIKTQSLTPKNSEKSNQVQIVKREEKSLQNIKTPNKNMRNKSIENQRPSTAPTKRHCCNYWDQTKLPEYNGLKSEYGLTAEQILQRKRDKFEFSKNLRVEKERKYKEEIRRQKENDQIFHSWLVKKKKEAAQKYSRKKLQSTFHLKTIPAPTKHLDKVGALRKKLLKREHTSYSLEEFFKNANPHEQKTYRIYLGLCIE